jgi:hypothetical protein
MKIIEEALVREGYVSIPFSYNHGFEKVGPPLTFLKQ